MTKSNRFVNSKSVKDREESDTGIMNTNIITPASMKAEFLFLLRKSTRVILQVITEKEMHGVGIEIRLREYSQSKICEILNTLYEYGYVSKRREGKNIYYKRIRYWSPKVIRFAHQILADGEFI